MCSTRQVVFVVPSSMRHILLNSKTKGNTMKYLIELALIIAAAIVVGNLLFAVADYFLL